MCVLMLLTAKHMVSADAMAHIEGSFYVGAEDGCEERPACCKY
jgi:hypothetical protein